VSLRMNGREILNIIYDDLKNTGFKLKPNFTFEWEAVYVTPEAFEAWGKSCPENPPLSQSDCPARLDASIGKVDISSFRLRINKTDVNYDTLTVRMGKLGAGTDEKLLIDTITYYVDVDNDKMKLIRKIEGISASSALEKTLAINVAALKFLYSDNLVDWYDKFEPDNDKEEKIAKGNAKYIKVIMVTKDPKKLSPTKDTYFTLITPKDFHKDDGALYERHEIVIPIPNNGLFP